MMLIKLASKAKRVQPSKNYTFDPFKIYKIINCMVKVAFDR